MLIAIIILLFFSVAYIAYDRIPYLLQKHSTMQQQRMDKVAVNLSRLMVVKEGKKIQLLFTVTPLVFGAAAFILSKNLLGLFVGAAVGLGIPRLVVLNMAAMRKNKFQDQLVDGLMILSSALKSGMSLNQAVEILVEEMPSPLNEEFALVMQENRMGVPLEECLVHLKQRMPLDDLGLIISAIGVARETGGDLTEIFSQLVFTIREKNKLERKVRTLTVQGRLQGVIMGILPIGFGFFINYVNPESINVLRNTKVGQMLIVYAVVSEIIGLILIRKLSRVEV
jgi:tight adherence protein B